MESLNGGIWHVTRIAGSICEDTTFIIRRATRTFSFSSINLQRLPAIDACHCLSCLCAISRACSLMVTTRALHLGALQKQWLVSPVLAGCPLDQSVCPSAQLGDHSNDCQAHDPAMDLHLPLLLGLGVSATRLAPLSCAAICYSRLLQGNISHRDPPVTYRR